MKSRKKTISTRLPKNRGIVVLEFILVFPLLVIALLAVLEFALILTAGQHVEFAARLGAKQAAEAMDLEDFNQPATMNNLKSQVDQYLNTAGYTDSCQVILEHTVPLVANPTQANPALPPADCPCDPEIGSLGTLPGTAVRVTVCLPMTGNVPNLLQTFGFDISTYTVRQSVVWIYER